MIYTYNFFHQAYILQLCCKTAHSLGGSGFPLKALVVMWHKGQMVCFIAQWKVVTVILKAVRLCSWYLNDGAIRSNQAEVNVTHGLKFMLLKMAATLPLWVKTQRNTQSLRRQANSCTLPPPLTSNTFTTNSTTVAPQSRPQSHDKSRPLLYDVYVIISLQTWLSSCTRAHMVH